MINHKNKEIFDVIIVGFGIAGASAAIEAADKGKSVLVLDRSYGGGASALSGGVVYAGGQTAHQTEAGVKDSPKNMFNYLQQEIDGVVSDDLLRQFCEESTQMITWLEKQGAEFEGTLCPYKTSYPSDEYYLYYSGNENSWPYKLHADAAPRGHRQVAEGMSSGHVLFEHLKKSALNKGVIFRPLSKVSELIMDGNKVAGVNYRTVEEGFDKNHRKLRSNADKFGNWMPPLGARYNKKADGLWDLSARGKQSYADAIILTAGGFIFNPEMKEKYAGGYKDISPLGTAGDDGNGIKLGLSAGGSKAHMEKMTAWRFISPPSAFIQGLSLNLDGKRLAPEDLYGAAFADIMIQEHDGKGYLIMDSTVWKEARKQIKSQMLTFQRAQAYYQFTFGRKKASSLKGLAEKINLPREEMFNTIKAYNAAIYNNSEDPAHKASELRKPIETGPFYAIDISIKSSFASPVPGLTLGGLRVNEKTGQVLTETDESIEGLYAAGRTAVGICSNSYISGLSLADGIFSGRRAARHASSLK